MNAGGRLRAAASRACRPGAHRQAIDYDRDPASQRLARSAGPVARRPGFHLRLLACLDRGHLVRRHPGQADDLVVDDPHPVLPDGAHPQLGLERHPELADDDHIQRRAQRLGHLQRDRDTAPRQAEHHHRLAPQVLQPGGQPPPRIRGPVPPAMATARSRRSGRAPR